MPDEAERMPTDAATDDGRIPPEVIEEWRRQRGTETFRAHRAAAGRLLRMLIRAALVGVACVIIGRIGGGGMEGAWLPWFGVVGAVCTMLIGILRLGHLRGTLLLGGAGGAMCAVAQYPNFFMMLGGFVALGTFVSLWFEHDR